MKFAKWLFTLFTFWSMQTVAMTPQTEQQLIELYRNINTAMLARDVVTLDRLLDSDFTLTHITGYQQPKSEWLADIQSGRMRYSQIQEVGVRATQHGDEASIIGQAFTTANIWGAKGTWRLQLAYTAKLKDAQWTLTQAVATLF